MPHVILTYGYDALGEELNVSDNSGGSITYTYRPGYPNGNQLASADMMVG